MGSVTLGFYLFFVLVFAGYWSLSGGTARKWLLLVVSYGLYATFDVRFLALLAGATAVGLICARLIAETEDPARRKTVLIVGLTLCLGVLGVFKYLDFFAASAVSMLSMLGLGVDPPALRLLLPIGISFYLFKVMSYLIDVYRRTTPATASALDFATYVAFFPQLLSGPIDRAGNLLPQLATARTFDYAMAVEGLRLLLWGFFKKVAIADGLAFSVGKAFGDWQSQPAPVLIAGAVLFSVQIYCDFSGYTDMATGLARLLGFTTVRNFAYPYFSQNVAEFWRRWNISVSSWFRDYVYISLGGSRVARARLVFNVMATFILSGLWHGANTTFLVWGGMLGVAVCFTALRQRPVLKAADTPGGERLTLPAAGRILATFTFITVSWVFFRAASVGEAFGILQGMLQWPSSMSEWLAPIALFPSTRLLLIAVVFGFFVVEWIQRRHECPLDIDSLPRVARWLAYTAVVWVTILLSQPLTAGRFIYFDF